MSTYSINLCIHSPTARQNCSWRTLSGMKEKTECGGYAVPVSARSLHAIYSWRLLIWGEAFNLGEKPSLWANSFSWFLEEGFPKTAYANGRKEELISPCLFPATTRSMCLQSSQNCPPAATWTAPETGSPDQRGTYIQSWTSPKKDYRLEVNAIQRSQEGCDGNVICATSWAKTSELLCPLLVGGDSFSLPSCTQHCEWHGHSGKTQRDTWLCVTPVRSEFQLYHLLYL